MLNLNILKWSKGYLSKNYMNRIMNLDHDHEERFPCFFTDPGERGQCVLDTPPKILFCDLRLDPGESKTCKKLHLKQHFR